MASFTKPTATIQETPGIDSPDQHSEADRAADEGAENHQELSDSDASSFAPGPLCRVERSDRFSRPCAGPVDISVDVHVGVGREHRLDGSRPGAGPPMRRRHSVGADTFRSGETLAGELAKLSNARAVERLCDQLTPMRERFVRVAGGMLEVVSRDSQKVDGTERGGRSFS